MGKFANRAENCGGGGDSPGVDCSSPTGYVNVGPSLDATVPGPVYLASGAPPHKASSFELLLHKNLGFRVGYSYSHSLSVKLQPNAMFSNKEVLISMFWKKDYFYLGQWKLFRAIQYEKKLSF